jgi:hypothetical protein
MAIKHCSKDLERSKSEEAGITPSSRIQNTDENLVEQNELNHTCKQADTNDLDRGPEYIERMQTGMEEWYSKPRDGQHVTDVVMCPRQRVYREIDRVPIDAKSVSIYSAGKAIHGAIQWLFLSDKRTFERKKYIEYED